MFTNPTKRVNKHCPELEMDLSVIHLAVPPKFSDLPTALQRRGRGYYIDTIVSPLQTALYSVIEKKKIECLIFSSLFQSENS